MLISQDLYWNRERNEIFKSRKECNFLYVAWASVSDKLELNALEVAGVYTSGAGEIDGPEVMY